MKEYIVKVQDDGSNTWYLNGKCHREDGPAVECADGSKSWWLNGKAHREDGPAVEYHDGTKCWWFNGKLHRKDGPAIEYPDGSYQWFLNGKRHRKDGPAVEWAGEKKKYWFLNGISYSYKQWLKKVNPTPCENKVVIIEGQKYKLVAVS